MSGVGSRGAGRWPGGCGCTMLCDQGKAVGRGTPSFNRTGRPPAAQPQHAPEDASADRKPWEV